MLSDTIYYVHDNSAPLEDSFTIQLSDSVQSAEVEIPVTIQYSDTESPTLSPSASMKLRLNEGKLFFPTNTYSAVELIICKL